MSLCRALLAAALPIVMAMTSAAADPVPSSAAGGPARVVTAAEVRTARPPDCPTYTCFFTGTNYRGNTLGVRKITNRCLRIDVSYGGRPYRSVVNPSRFQGFVYANANCTGRSRAIMTHENNPNFGFAARSVRYVCVIC